MSILKDHKRLARLSESIGVGTHGERPMTPIEVAYAIEDLKNATGDSIKDIARNRLHVDPSTCRLFLSLLDLPPEWSGMFHYGSADSSGRIPLSLACRIAPKFKNNKLTKRQVDLLKSAMLDSNESAKRDDIIAVITCIANHPEKSTEQCIRDIMNLTPKIIRGYVVITDIDSDFVSKIRKECTNSDMTEQEILLLKLSKHFSKNSINGVKIKNDKFVQISFDKKGYAEFYSMAKKKGVSANSLVDHILSKEVEDYG